MLDGLKNAVAAAILRLPEPVVSWLAGAPIVIESQELDPQVQLLLKLMALAGVPPLETLSPTEARDFYRGNAPLLDLRSVDLEQIDHRRIPGLAAEIPIRIYFPRARPRPAPLLVYYHGGGWVIGDLDTHDPPCRSLADRVGCIVVAVDYRRAPEHKFPAAVDDAYAAYRWVLENAASLGGDPKKIAVAGDSAGA